MIIAGAAATFTACVATIWWLTAAQPRRKERRDNEEDFNDDDRFQVPLPAHVERNLYKEERRKRMLPLLAMKKPMYDNILMQDPDGNPLSTISLKKAQWYIHKNLADWIVRHDDDENHPNGKSNNITDPSDKQSIIRLRFQPSNRVPADQALYHTAPKANQCVVCGAQEHYMRHYVVPFCYRTLFPDDYKTHLSHDVVLTCADCHVRAEQYTQQRRNRLEKAVRKDPRTAVPQIVNRSRQTLAKKALALLNQIHHMPPDRIAQCQADVRDFLQLPADQDLTNEHLKQVSSMEYTEPNPNYIPGPILVVEPMLEEYQKDGRDDTIRNFVQDWRQYFLDTSQPRYLPAGWSIDAPVHCDKRHVRDKER